MFFLRFVTKAFKQIHPNIGHAWSMFQMKRSIRWRFLTPAWCPLRFNAAVGDQVQIVGDDLLVGPSPEEKNMEKT